jgi:hypothetical protein
MKFRNSILIISALAIGSILFTKCSKVIKKEKKLEPKNTSELNIRQLIEELKRDSSKHTKVGKVLTEQEVIELESKLGKKIPQSYRTFLKEFGNGAYWLYNNSMNDITYLYHLNTMGRLNMDSLEYEDGTKYPMNSLLCLMSDDSNGGAWVWLTTEKSPNGEWPLAYYSFGRLYYKVENFTEWIRLLVSCKHEVIRELDKNHKLGLG